MLDFPSKTIDYIKKKLLKEQREVEKNLKEVEEDDPAKSDGLVEASEPGTDSYIADVHTKTLILGGQLKKTSKSIQKALLKIKKGSYGKCEKCGKQIEVGRLMAMPIAQYCLSCSKKSIVK